MKRLLCIFACLLVINAFASERQYAIRHYSIDDGLSQNTVMSILKDKQGYMWFGTWDGLNRFDGYNFTVYKATEDGRPAQVNNRVDFLYEDEEERIWWRTYDGCFYVLDKQSEHITHQSFDSVPAKMKAAISQQKDSVRMDSKGRVWMVDDEEGISLYKNNTWKRMTPTLDNRYKGQLRRNFIFLEDKGGRVWVNPTGGGFGYYDERVDNIVFPFAPRLTNMIHTAYIADDGLLWISTYDGGVDCIDLNTYPFLLHDMSVGRNNGEVRAMAQLKNGQQMMFTKDERRIYAIAETSRGLLYGTKGDGILDMHFRPQKNIYPLNCDDVYDIIEDEEGTLYVATYGGGVNMFVQGTNEPIMIGEEYKVRDIVIANNILWGATTTGLLKYDRATATTEFINTYDVRCLCVLDSILWIGTFGGGLQRLNIYDQNLVLTPVTTNTDIVLSITSDGENIWFSSERSITRLNANSGEYRYFDVLYGERNSFFTEAAAIRTQGNKLLFGYSSGYCEIDPAKQLRTEGATPIYITGCWINGERIVSNDIRLPSDIGSFSVAYAALTYMGQDKILYAYKMEGVDKDWHYVRNQRMVIYSNLASGHYTFRVRSSNRVGEWDDEEAVLHIEVARPMWLSWWAILCYVLAVLLFVYVIFKAISIYEQLHRNLEVEKQVTDIKLRFFTNISHELRTPLTLITAPVENILQTEKLSTSVRSQLEIVRGNGQRMLRLINQLLDFRKIQNKKMRLKIQRTVLSELVQNIATNFTKEAYDKRISLNIENETTDSIVWVDRERVDTIVYNLLSNAFKFTPAGKSITIGLREKSEFILLSVKDEGIGIPLDKRSVLFERFSSHNELQNASDKQGTGIGLNLVKELVDLHHAYIEVESELGKGSTFTVMFKKGKEHFGNEVDIIIDDGTNMLGTSMQDLQDLDQMLQNEKRRDRKILIVEDNEDMRKFLTSILSVDYDTLSASDGKQALEIMKSDMPDLIISDLMMPNMDGIELTEKVKSAVETNHIPVILLTAKSAVESRIEALGHGADDYITKPFEPEYLRARVKNIIKQREMLETSFRKRLMNLELNKSEQAMPEDTFLAKLLSIMEKQMDNNALTVEDLVDEVGMGRTVFFNKIKGMTGLSPVEFIREMRIKRAAQLLETTSYNISEITYMVGMNDSRYFSKCFKNTYGVTPTEYKKKMTK